MEIKQKGTVATSPWFLTGAIIELDLPNLPVGVTSFGHNPDKGARKLWTHMVP